MQLFELIKEFPFATNGELAEKSGKSIRTISRLLSALKGKKLIERSWIQQDRLLEDGIDKNV